MSVDPERTASPRGSMKKVHEKAIEDTFTRLISQTEETLKIAILLLVIRNEEKQNDYSDFDSLCNVNIVSKFS